MSGNLRLMHIVDPQYVDDGALRGQDDISVERFLAAKDRTHLSGQGTPFFSGREAEVSAFRATINALAIGVQANATLVVEGPPGAGKTALLAQFQEELSHLPPIPHNGRRWLAPCLDGAEAMCPAEIMAAVDEAIVTRLATDWRTATNPEAKKRLWFRIADLAKNDAPVRDIGAFISGIADRGVSAMGFTLGPKRGQPPATLRQLHALRGKEWAKWQIVLMIDEAQAITAHAPGAAPATLSSIHQGLLDLPVSFCAFGISGTWDALGEVGISRGATGRDLPLAGLAAWEAQAAVNRCFRQFQVEHGEQWAPAILTRSANWPQHLAGYLNAALTVMSETADAPDRMGDARKASLSKAIALGDATRQSYYERRLRILTKQHPLGAECAKSLVPILLANPQGASRTEIMHCLTAPPHGLSTKEAGDFLQAAEHGGFLMERSAISGFVMPIPSLAGYLLDEPLPELA